MSRMQVAAADVHRQISGPLVRLPLIESGSQQVVSSIEIFDRYLGSDAGLKHLKVVLIDDKVMEAMAEKFLGASEYTPLWLLLLQELKGTETEMQCVSELYDSFQDCKKIPTGLRLVHKSHGRFPLNKSVLESCKNASEEAKRIFLVMCDGYFQGKQANVCENSCRMRMVVATMAFPQCDSMLRFLTSRSLAFALGISVDMRSEGYSVTISQNDCSDRRRLACVFLDLLYSNYCSAMAAFTATQQQLRELHKERTNCLEHESDAVHEYKLLLYELSGHDDEETMPVSLNHYLKDHEDLRLLHAKQTKKHLAVIDIEARYSKELLNYAHLVPCVRFACGLLLHALGLALPTHVCVQSEMGRAEDQPLLGKIHHMFVKLPWDSVIRQFYAVEREIYGEVYTRLLAVVACQLFPDLQESLSADEFEMRLDEDTAYDEEKKYYMVTTMPSLVRKALGDLLNPTLPWTSGDQVFLEEDPWEARRTMHRPMRRCRLDTRISSAMVYWAGHNNPLVQERLRSWKVHITDEDTPLMWPRLLVRSDRSQEASEFKYDDGSEPFIAREYKEYYTDLADQAMCDFLRDEMRIAEEQDQSYYENACNIIKLCTNFRISAHYGNRFAENLYGTLIIEAPFGFEGNGMLSLRGQHPLSIVHQLSTNWGNPADAVSYKLAMDHKIYFVTLFKIIRDAGKRHSKTEDILLFNIAVDLLASLVQGPLPVQRVPSLSPLFKDETLEPVHTLAINTLKAHYEAQCVETLKLLAGVVFRAKPADLCPIGVLHSPAVSSSLCFMTGMCFVLPPEVVLTAVSDACVKNFAENLWHTATLSPYERHQMEEDEREERTADKDDVAMQSRIAAKKELRRQTYVNFFFFALEGGLEALAGHYLSEGWNLSEGVLEAFYTDMGPVSNEFRCITMEFVNVVSLSLDDLLQLLTKQTNFLAKVMLDCLARMSSEETMPKLLTLKKYPRDFMLDPELINLRVVEQTLRLSSRIVNFGRVGPRVPGGRVPHMSETNEFILYFAMSDTAISLEVATKLLAYASVQLRAISLSFSKEASPDGSSWDEYIDFCLFRKLQDSALVVVSFFNQLCRGRIELQTKVQTNCMMLFDHLPRLLSQSNFLSGTVLTPRRLFPDDRYYHFHIGLARSIAVLLQGLCNRHEGCTNLVESSGCMKALCAGLNDCMDGSLPLEEWIIRKWSKSITETVQTVVARSIESWQYCQDVSGISGLYTLIYLGNNTIKKLCVTTFLDKATDENAAAAAAYIEDMVAADALNNLRVLIEIKDDDDLVNLTLTLIKIVVITSKAFRLAAFDPKQSAFFSTVTSLLSLRHTEIQANICDIFSYFCAEDAATLRYFLTNNHAIKKIQSLASSSGEAAFGGGEAERAKSQMLAKAAATTIANLTKSDESEYLVGSAPLRPTLTKSGILPTLRK